MAVALALLSSLLWGGADFVGGLVSRRRPAIAVVAWSQTAGLVTIAAVALATGAYTASLGWLPWSVMAGLSGGVGLICFYTALSIGTMGVVSPIAALGAVVPVLAGLAGGDRPSRLQWAGMALGLLGALAASGPELAGGARGRSVLLAALAGLGFGVALFGIQRGARSSPVMTLVGMRAASVGSFALAALLSRRAIRVPPRDLRVVAGVGVGDVTANLAFGVASVEGMVSVVAVLGSLYPVVTVVLGRFVLAERLAMIQQLGVGLAVLGIILLALG